MPGCGSNPDFLLGGRTSASAECRHWSGRAVRWFDFAQRAKRQEADIIAAGREGRVLDPDRISK